MGSGAGIAVVLAVFAVAGAGTGQPLSARRDIWPIQEVRRSRGAACLDDAVPEVRALRYGNADRSVSVAYPRWASARVTGEITYILLSEVMGYKSHLLDTRALYSSHPVNYAAGCRDGDDTSGKTCNVSDPLVHITVETWMAGYRRVAQLPEMLRPTLLRTMDLPIIDTYFIWPSVRDAGLATRCRPMLDDYRGYQVRNADNNNAADNSSACQPARASFDSWQVVLQRFKNRTYVDEEGKTQSLLSKCSELSTADSRNDARYIELTCDDDKGCDTCKDKDDKDVVCACQEDVVWFSKSCRHDPKLCVPLVIQYTYDFAMQISFFLEMPVAIFMVNAGKNGDYSEYYEVIRESKAIFGWWLPDDALMKSGDVPVPVNMPRTNKLEHVKGIYKTGLGENLMRNYAWRELPNVDTTVTYFASQINFYHEDVEKMMVRSRVLKEELVAGQTWNKEPMGAPGLGAKGSWEELGFTDEGPLNDQALVARQVACEWVRNNAERWRAWIPALCEPGTLPDEALQKCLACPAGYYCSGYAKDDMLCPHAYFCPVNSSLPQKCGRGRTSERGSIADSDCRCSSSTVWIGNRCRSIVAFFLPAVILPIFIVLGLLVMAYMFLVARRKDAQFTIDMSELDFGTYPSELGSGSAGQSFVYLVTYQQRKVAVKIMKTPLGQGSPVILPHFGDALDRTEQPAFSSSVAGFHRDGSNLNSTSAKSVTGDERDNHMEVGSTSGRSVEGSSMFGGMSTGPSGHRKSRRQRNKQFLKDVRRQVQSWCRMPHNQVAVCHGLCMQEDQVMIVMELMAYGSLFDMLHNSTFEMDEEMAREILTDVAQGLQCLHSSKPQPAVHRSISSSNVLLDRNLNAKLSDVGYPRAGSDLATARLLASSLAVSNTSAQLTPSAGPTAAPDDSWVLPSMIYLSPEVLKTGVHTTSDDVYAFGILCYEVVARRDPYEDGTDSSLLKILQEVLTGTVDFAHRLPLPPGVNPSLSGLCRDCTHLKGAMRPTSEEIERRARSLCLGSGHNGSFQNMTEGGGFGEQLSKRFAVPVRRRKGSASSNGSGSGQLSGISDSLSHSLSHSLSQSQPPYPWVSFSRRSDSSTGAQQPSNASDALLHKVFPPHIAATLKEGKKVQPEEYPCVTIFFSDIVGFTNISSTMAPHLVMSMLDRLYTKFDALSERYDVFKVETIGDAYMAVANLHKKQAEDHVHRIACFARAAIATANDIPIDLDDESKGTLKIRVGFHSGPVVANVVGRANPRYCLFGDTVNVASRMESNSMPGHILCTRESKHLLLDQAGSLGSCHLEPVTIHAKGKGVMKCYWVNDLSDPWRGIALRFGSQANVLGGSGTGIGQPSGNDFTSSAPDEVAGEVADEASARDVDVEIEIANDHDESPQWSREKDGASIVTWKGLQPPLGITSTEECSNGGATGSNGDPNNARAGDAARGPPTLH